MEEATKIALLRIAREALSEAAAGPFSPVSHVSADGLPSDPALTESRGAFVTLHCQDGSVRGCVGTTSAIRPLIEVVSDMARAAAIRDPRFSPVAPEEVPSLEVEISVLEPPHRVKALDEVEIGRHGLLVVGRGRRGLLLPQVAEERGWDATTFAEHTCKKAGLAPRAYEDHDVTLYRFGAEVFSEREAVSLES